LIPTQINHAPSERSDTNNSVLIHYTQDVSKLIINNQNNTAINKTFAENKI